MYIETEQRGRVRIVTLNRPQARNTIVMGLIDELDEAIAAAASDTAVGALVLRGAGEHFCAGGDLRALGDSAAREGSEDERAQVAQGAGHVVKRLAELPMPTVAMLRGSVAGGGLALAAACDFRLADVTLKLTFAYSRIGLSGDFAATPLLLRLLGLQRFRELAFLSPVLDAAGAERMGLVRAVDDVEAESLDLAGRLADMAPCANAGIKANIAAALEGDFDHAIATEARSFARCQLDPDHREAAMAFLGKRKPVFAASRDTP